MISLLLLLLLLLLSLLLSNTVHSFSRTLVLVVFEFYFYLCKFYIDRIWIWDVCVYNVCLQMYLCMYELGQLDQRWKLSYSTKPSLLFITNVKVKNLGLFLVFTFNPIEDGPFRSYSRMEGAKMLLSLKFVTHILQ